MSKKLNDLPSDKSMKSNKQIDELLQLKFSERFDVSDHLNQRIMEASFKPRSTKVLTPSFWYAAAGIAILICINILSIRNYTEQLEQEKIKEVYVSDWSNLDLN